MSLEISSFVSLTLVSAESFGFKIRPIRNRFSKTKLSYIVSTKINEVVVPYFYQQEYKIISLNYILQNYVIRRAPLYEKYLSSIDTDRIIPLKISLKVNTPSPNKKLLDIRLLDEVWTCKL